VVGAGAVVTRDVPPRTVVVGVPARIVQNLDSEASHPDAGATWPNSFEAQQGD
jgi:acetyltransferase-like isoleucine patch superfamily enzyme